MIRRRPLLRAAAVGGVAYTAGSHAATKSTQQAYMDQQQNAQIADLQQQQQYMQQQAAAPPPVYQQPAPPPPVYQQPAPPPPEAAAPAPSGGMTDETYEQLKKLGELHESGVLTDDEFNSAKQKILSSI
jgi:outer membrane murein-binding lipoprotein Lpp